MKPVHMIIKCKDNTGDYWQAVAVHEQRAMDKRNLQNIRRNLREVNKGFFARMVETVSGALA